MALRQRSLAHQSHWLRLLALDSFIFEACERCKQRVDAKEGQGVALQVKSFQWRQLWQRLNEGAYGVGCRSDSAQIQMPERGQLALSAEGHQRFSQQQELFVLESRIVAQIKRLDHRAAGRIAKHRRKSFDERESEAFLIWNGASQVEYTGLREVPCRRQMGKAYLASAV